jgi:hypothetical protein
MEVAATVAAFVRVTVGHQLALLGDTPEVDETSYPVGAVTIIELVKYCPLMVKLCSADATALEAVKPNKLLTEGALIVGLLTVREKLSKAIV